jgi:hypothetical protein
VRSMAADVLPRCPAWLPRGCQCAEHGCPGDAEVRGSKAGALVKIQFFTCFAGCVNPVPNGHANICMYRGDCELIEGAF